jgi:hypothetical protein
MLESEQSKEVISATVEDEQREREQERVLS